MLSIELHLRIVGVLLLALVVMNLFVPRRFGCRVKKSSFANAFGSVVPRWKAVITCIRSGTSLAKSVSPGV